METWTSVWVSLASLQTLARARFPSSGILVAMPPRPRHRPSLPPPKHHHLPHHLPRRHRLQPLPTVPLRPLPHPHRPHNPLQRLLHPFLLHPAAVRLYPRAPLLLSRELLRRREAQTTPLLNRRLGSRTFPTWVRRLSTWERWFASLAHLEREGRCIPGPSMDHSCTDGRRLRSCSPRIPASFHSLCQLYHSLIFDSQGCQEVDSFASTTYLCRRPCAEAPKLQVHCDILNVPSILWCSQGVISG